jgi:hypothetical protein
MSNALKLTVARRDGEQALVFDVQRMYNLAFTLRDAARMQQHLDEIAKSGIPGPKVDRPPAIYPVSDWTITTAPEITVQREKTSGEVEITILKHDGSLLVGVGSDHTDRELEALDILWSKQVCPNVLAPTVWRWEDVKDHWDEISMESEVGGNGERTLYQQASVAEFWTPEEMLASLEGRVKLLEDGLVLFSGTVASKQGTLTYADRWTIRMVDPVLSRKIEHTYRVTVLSKELL